jgi:DNA-binding NarL/FixJ family response regulator
MSGVCASRAPRSFIDEFARSSLKPSCYKPRPGVVPPDESDSQESSANAALKQLSEIPGSTKSVANEPVKILLADDHPVVRFGMRALLQAEPGFRVVGEASDGAETLRLVEALTPEIVLLDISLPDRNGLDVTRQLRREAPNVKVVIFTMHFGDEVERQCLQAGARAYVLKSDDDGLLLDALHAVRDDRPYFTRRISRTVDTNTGSRLSNPGGPRGPDRVSPLAHLTPREVEIVQMVCEGMTSIQIAAQFAISRRTVESHRSNVARKLQITSLSDLVRYAYRTGIFYSDGRDRFWLSPSK